MIHSRFGWAVVVVLAVLAAACSGGSSAEALDPLPPLDSTASTTTETTAPPTTTTTEPTTTEAPEVTRPTVVVPTEWEGDREEIFGRYLLYWEALDAALAPPEADPDFPLLADLLGPEMESDIRGEIQEFTDGDWVKVLPENSTEEHVLRLPNISTLAKTEGNKVLVQDCWVMDSELRMTDGVLDQVRDGFTVLNATLEVLDGEWIVITTIEQSEGDLGWETCEQYANSQ